MGRLLRFYLVVATGGAVIMALEILSSRVLSPHFGNSVYVWGSIISVFLAALAIGYYLGGKLADRHPHLPVLGRVIAFAALFQVALLFGGSEMAEAVGRWTRGSPYGTLLATTLLFGPVSVLLATVSPFAVRLAAREIAQVGNTAGRLYALSTAGSLVGTLVCTFVLIPFLTLEQIFGLLVALTAATAVLALVESFRQEAAALALALVLLVVGGLGLSHTPRRDATVLYVRATPYQTLRVLESAGLRYLECDGVRQSAVEVSTGEPGLLVLRYPAAALLVNPEIERALVLGMGSGVAGRYLASRIPGLSLDYVEVDPAVAEVAREFFGHQESPDQRVHVEDARRFLASSQETWDLVFQDTFIGLSLPFHLSTREFYQVLKPRLAANGVLALNLAAGLDDPFSRAVFLTVQESFSQAVAIRVGGRSNVLVLATDRDLDVSPAAFRERAPALDRLYGFDPSLEVIARGRIERGVDLSDAMVLEDGFAPVDRLIHQGEMAEELLEVSR